MLLVLICWSAPVEAQSQKAIAEAKQNYHDANQLYDMGRFAEAATKYEAAFRLTDQAVLLFNLAQAYRQAGNVKAAKGAYLGYLRRVPNAPEKAEIARHLLEIEQQISEEESKRSAMSPPREGPVKPAPQPAPAAAASVYNPWGAPLPPGTAAPAPTTPAPVAPVPPVAKVESIPSVGEAPEGTSAEAQAVAARASAYIHQERVDDALSELAKALQLAPSWYRLRLVASALEERQGRSEDAVNDLKGYRPHAAPDEAAGLDAKIAELEIAASDRAAAVAQTQSQKKQRRSRLRTTGIVFMSLSAANAILAVTLGGLGSSTNDAIHNGGFSDQIALTDAYNTGQGYNSGAYATLSFAVIFAVIGVPLYGAGSARK
jgi:hypothetical protein